MRRPILLVVVALLLAAVGAAPASAGPAGPFSRTVPSPPIKGTWERPFHASTSVLFKENLFRLWYVSVPKEGGKNGVGYAASSEGGTDWTTRSGAPLPGLFSNKPWDDGGIVDISVLFAENRFRMYFTATNTSGRFRVGRAISQDGLHWPTRQSPLWSGDTGEFSGNGPLQLSVIFECCKYRMWFAATNNDGRGAIGYAASTDGLSWNSQPEPVLTGRKGIPWEADFGLFQPKALFDPAANRYRLWYVGCCLQNDDPGDPFTTVNGFGVASSSSAAGGWTHGSDVPVVPWDFTTNGQRDCDLQSPSVVLKGGTFRMLFVQFRYDESGDDCYVFQGGTLVETHFSTRILVGTAP